MKASQAGLSIAIFGVTGAVGRELVSILGERRVPVGEIKGYATKESLGIGVDYLDDEVLVRDIKDADLTNTDVVFIALPSGSSAGEISAEYHEKAINSGALVIEVSGSRAAMLGRSSLVVPELNGELVESLLVERSSAQGLGFSCPCGASVALSVVLAPLASKAKLERVVVSIYQAVSNAGRRGMDELWKQTMALFNGAEVEPERFPSQIAFNCLPHVGEFEADGSTAEEARIVAETRTILENPDLPIAVTSVQVPVFNCCALSVNVQFDEEITADQARKILEDSYGVIVQDIPSENVYPTCFALGGSDAVYVGRIRKDTSVKYGLSLWIVVDNLRKGSALNAIEILELAIAAGSKVGLDRPSFLASVH